MICLQLEHLKKYWECDQQFCLLVVIWITGRKRKIHWNEFLFINWKMVLFFLLLIEGIEIIVRFWTAFIIVEWHFYFHKKFPILFHFMLFGDILNKSSCFIHFFYPCWPSLLTFITFFLFRFRTISVSYAKLAIIFFEY